MKTRAVLQMAFGGPEVLAVGAAELEPIGPRDVRIKVAATSLNPVDLGTRAGATLPAAQARFPLILGWDVAGIIDAVGADVIDLAPGACVVGMSVMPATQRGTHAEHVVLDAEHVVPISSRIPAVVAAALPLAGVTAWQALRAVEVAAGQTLLVSSVRSAVGALAAAMAVHRGVHVVTFAADEAARAEALALGVEPLTDGVMPVIDVGLDVRGGENARVVHARVRNHGRYVTVVPEWWKPGGIFTRERDIEVHVLQVTAERSALASLVALAEAGVLRPRIGEVFSFEHAARAHGRLASGQVHGKVVLVP